MHFLDHRKQQVTDDDHYSDDFDSSDLEYKFDNNNDNSDDVPWKLWIIKI